MTHVDPYAVCQKVAEAVRAVIPAGMRAKFTVNVVDSEGPKAHDVSVEFRPPQPKAGMGK